MLLLRTPRDEFIREVIEEQRGTEFTYSDVGLTRTATCPPDFRINESSAVIANGEEAFARAKNAIQNYDMLQLGWINPVGPTEPIAENSIVCTLARQFPVYSLNVARIVYVDNESANRFAFGYGTLAEYPMIGEERFTVEFDDATGDVTYTIFSFSRPRSLLFRATLPLMRRAQRRFCRDSIAAMQQACTIP